MPHRKARVVAVGFPLIHSLTCLFFRIPCSLASCFTQLSCSKRHCALCLFSSSPRARYVSRSWDCFRRHFEASSWPRLLFNPYWLFRFVFWFRLISFEVDSPLFRHLMSLDVDALVWVKPINSITRCLPYALSSRSHTTFGCKSDEFCQLRLHKVFLPNPLINLCSFPCNCCSGFCRSRYLPPSALWLSVLATVGLKPLRGWYHSVQLDSFILWRVFATLEVEDGTLGNPFCHQ